MKNVTTDPLIDRPPARQHGKLDRLLRQQRSLAWVLSALTLVATVVFFALMSLDGIVQS